MEVLTRMLCRNEGMGWISRFSVGNGFDNGFMISHLLFANDTILFCIAKREKLLYIRMVLTSFVVFMILKVNVSKNAMVHVRDVGSMEELAELMATNYGRASEQGRINFLAMCNSMRAIE